nr:hypothetical protein BaRGS_006782 [Batillaria attramentaria]
MTAEIGQLRLIVAALSAKLKEPREPPAATVKTSEQPAKPGARCYWCDQAGHFERACPAKESYRQRKRPRRRRRKSKPKGQHQQAPPSAPPQQTAHPNKQQEKPATPVVGRQASGSGCFGRPWRRKGQEATVGAELEWDHEPQVLSFLPFIPAAAPVDLAPTLAPIPSIVRAVTQPEVLAMAAADSVPVGGLLRVCRQDHRCFSGVCERMRVIHVSVRVWDQLAALGANARNWLVRDRIYRYLSRPLHLWNMGPGAPYMMLEFSDALLDFPFFYRQLGAAPVDKFTAVIYATSPVISSSPLFRLLRNVAKSPYVHKIIVLWHCEIPPPPSRRWPADLGVPVLVKTRNIKSVNARFAPYKEIETDAVFGLDEDALLTTEEIDFAFSVWKEFPDRIVGYPARSHYWDELRGKWRYSSKWANEYSMVLTGAAVYHRYYNYMYTHYASTMLTQRVDASSNCHDILLNFLVSHVTRRPPVKLTQRKQYRESALTNSVAPGGGAAPNGNKLSAWSEQQHFAQRQTCMEEFVSLFGYMPLLRAKSRMDPLLFKDPVSNLRKKYRKIELVQN